MKTPTSIFLKLSGIVLISSIVLISCGSSAEEMKNREMNAKSLADSISSVISTSTPSNSQTNIAKHDSNRVFVRKADLHFKVKDVKTATFDIERIVNENNGYVTSSELESHVNYKNTVRISADSMQDITNYSVQNNIILRIPNETLDKTLSEIAVLIDYLDHRKIKSDDVTKQLMAAKLSQKRFVNHKQRLEKVIDEKGKKLNQTVDAENELLVKQEMADGTRLDAMETMHDVEYSTVTIAIYQKETTKKETYAYSLPIEPYKPNFFQRLGASVSDGAWIFSEIILFIIKLWPLALLAFGIIALIKLVIRRKWLA